MTLAQSVYNDEKVKETFHVRAWACVSNEFDALALTKTILQKVGAGGAPSHEALLAYHALGAVNFDNCPDLKPAGEKMAVKCAGPPLAAKTVGGVLRSKYELNDWTAIAKSKIWDLPEETNGVPQALKLSYFYLPSDLKRCFAYCAVFPKDYEFDKDDLISLWMAEGLLTPKKKRHFATHCPSILSLYPIT
ncbi:hypothetical protein CDL15_Pgr012749 [Punica granatum]|uniref:Disease resistance protein winged helix domain-containing protein n=1 Tax=Punica granatum TaxID=22663 RepID=A0A218XEN3_PUNGR|nr:hypothetical protein CDL15_Pgr012749 [Punica granatum]